MKISIFVLALIVLGGAGYMLFNPGKTKTDFAPNNETAVAPIVAYKNVNTTELASMLETKDFTLIDVHIPEQQHIPSTDAFIPFNEIDRLAMALPDKNKKIVLYCRSGGMSAVASEALAKQGYTNVYNLLGGMNKWKQEGRPSVPIGSLSR